MILLRQIVHLCVVMLFSVFDASMAFAVPVVTSDISYFQTETTHVAQADDVSFAARAPPLAVTNVAITGGVTVMYGRAFALYGQEAVAALFGFDADLNATTGGVNVELPGGVKVNGTQAADDILAPPAPTTRYEVSPAQAEQYLLDMGIPPPQAQSFAQSFDGPIYIREALPGESFGMYSGGPVTNPTAQFLTPHTAGNTPAQVVDNLVLPPSNPATQLNAATINQPIGVLEGVIAPQSWNGGVTGGGWQVFVPGGSQFGTQPVTIGSQLQ